MAQDTSMAKRTTVEIRGEDFYIDGRPTYEDRFWAGYRIEGLLFNSRMVQATFDDRNADTRPRWAYPDSNVWDPDRNVEEFVGMLPEYRKNGLLAVTLNLQGGSPESYSREQPWENSGFDADGQLRPAYLARLARVLDSLDKLGMVAILGLFYFGQDERLRDESAVVGAVDGVVDSLLEREYRNVVVEIANECDVPRYEHEVLQPHRIHELISRVRDRSRDGRHLLAGTSFRGRSVPSAEVLAASDLALLHGNGVMESGFIQEMVERTRERSPGRPIPIVFNEDDHYDFDLPTNNLTVATQCHASWGFFDAGPGAGGKTAHSDYQEGYQNVPVNWSINTPRKRSFFDLVRQVTGSDAS